MSSAPPGLTGQAPPRFCSSGFQLWVPRSVRANLNGLCRASSLPGSADPLPVGREAPQHQAGSGQGDVKPTSQRQVVRPGSGSGAWQEVTKGTCQRMLLPRMLCFWPLPCSGDRDSTQPRRHQSLTMPPYPEGPAAKNCSTLYLLSPKPPPFLTSEQRSAEPVPRHAGCLPSGTRRTK